MRIFLQPSAGLSASFLDRESGDNANPEVEWPSFPFYFSKTNRVDGCPLDIKAIKESVHPHVLDWVVAGQASLGTRCAPSGTGHGAHMLIGFDGRP
jgi:hypothetical protein